MQVFWGLILSDGGLTYRKANGVSTASFVFSQSIRYYPFFHVCWIVFVLFYMVIVMYLLVLIKKLLILFLFVFALVFSLG
jgi:hypothetical protein